MYKTACCWALAPCKQFPGQKGNFHRLEYPATSPLPLSDRLYEKFARHCFLDQRIRIDALTYAPIVVDIFEECTLRCEAMMSTAAFSRYLFTTHVEPLNPLSLEVALNALRNPPVPNGSGSIEKSTVVGLPVRAITDMSKLKISAEVVVSVMSFPNFSMSTTDRLCGTNLHGI